MVRVACCVVFWCMLFVVCALLCRVWRSSFVVRCTFRVVFCGMCDVCRVPVVACCFLFGVFVCRSVCLVIVYWLAFRCLCWLMFVVAGFVLFVAWLLVCVVC